MKTIYLDIDGVLNNKSTLGKIDQDKMSLLNEAVKKTGARVIVSSSWRTKGIDYIRQLFQDSGAQFPIYDVTDKGDKEDSIREYGNLHGYSKSVILDDELQGGGVVRTNGHLGIQKSDIDEIIKLLK